MTLNVLVNPAGVPFTLPNELLMLHRQNIEFEVKIDNLGKKNLKGTVLTV